MILALSALASLHGSSRVVHMEWCTQPERAVLGNPQFMRWIPRWTGYDYPIATLHDALALPNNVRLYSSGHSPRTFQGLVTEDGTVPAWGAISLTSTMYCRALTMGPGRNWTVQECVRAYKQVSLQFRPVKAREEDMPYVLVHFRSGDANTEARDERPFCTPDVLRELHAAGMYMKVISNNHSFSLEWMRGLPSVYLVHSNSVFQDIELALSATAIVQHASTGWSSYTSVPAMAKSIPLINTFTGSEHRFDFFARFGAIPTEFHSCKDMDSFMQKVQKPDRKRRSRDG